jgi:hypothetical protein
LETQSQWPDRVARITLAGADFRSPDVLPTADDANLRHARATYEGRAVWAYGRFELGCGRVTYEAPRLTPLRIRRIARVLGPSPVLHLGEQAVGYLGAGFSFTTTAPLVVFFDTPREVGFPASTAPTACTFWRMFGDDWQLDVTYSRAPPRRAHSEWSEATLADIAAGRVRLGMTHAVVAWALGFPNQYGTRAELMRAPSWVYDALPPGRAEVDFQADRVVRYVPPRMLP